MTRSLAQLVEEFSTLKNKQLIVNRICAVAVTELASEFDAAEIAAVLDEIQGLGAQYAEQLKNIESLEFEFGEPGETSDEVEVEDE